MNILKMTMLSAVLCTPLLAMSQDTPSAGGDATTTSPADTAAPGDTRSTPGVDVPGTTVPGTSTTTSTGTTSGQEIGVPHGDVENEPAGQLVPPER